MDPNSDLELEFPRCILLNFEYNINVAAQAGAGLEPLAADQPDLRQA